MLEGLPLLLTADGLLRKFDSNKPVYSSAFSDLFAERADLFVHSEFFDELPHVSRMINEGKPLPGVMVDFEVGSLALYMPDVFSTDLKGTSKHVPWTFYKKGVLSEAWFKRLWELLENDAKPEPGEKNVSLDPLVDWPIIPTACGKLVTIGNGKSVLDMSESRTENILGKNVRKILKAKNCPCLREHIAKSFREKFEPTQRSSVLDPYVAHPYSSADVLHVLDYMRNRNPGCIKTG